ncbi:hypothetical protein EWM64_g717 [Hericium alpestre]|uniref:Yeast cell wall synthesis Kre9/Knh1-like N-terminal domain-containing protein n=1 Tax=Hericium alpestre TaxID=135208 RepID=A0A4Z0ACA8_9AGAM|nr:hypothetical protein EWM64_g717 [Hericium alpestre]
MICLGILAMLAVGSDLVNAAVYPTQPVKNTVYEAGRSVTVKWKDDGKELLIWEMPNMRIDLYDGEDNLLDTVATDVDPASLSQEIWISPSLGNNGSDYSLHFVSDHPKIVVYTARFTIIGMAGPDAGDDSSSSSSDAEPLSVDVVIPGTYKTAPLFTLVYPSTTFISSQAAIATPTTVSAPPLPSHDSNEKQSGPSENGEQRNAAVGRMDMEKIKFRLVFILWPALMGITMAM